MSILSSTSSLGSVGEQIVKGYLGEQGLLFITRNFNTRYGEIDLIFKDKKTIYFIEVKTRTSNYSGYPEESVTPKKIKRIKKAIALFIAIHSEYTHFQKMIQVASVEYKYNDAIITLIPVE